MILPFACPKCEKPVWTIKYNTETKEHKISCYSCGQTIILEQVFCAKRRPVPNVKPIAKTPNVSAVAQS